MKLIRKINSRFFLASLLILVFLGMALALLLYFTVNEQVEEKMKHTLYSIKHQIGQGEMPNTLPPYFEISTIPQTKDTLFFNETTIKGYEEKHGENFKQLNTITTINAKTYKIEIRESHLETDDFIENIVSVVLIAIFLMLATLYIINRKISQTVWSGFYSNLKKVKSFTLQQLETIKLNTTNISEFDELNEVLENLMYRASNDYRSLKQFSEDASHELQTPLAIIRSKLEALIESNNINEQQAEKITTIYDTTNRLTRLNKDLLLLTKIENKQFNEDELIDISQFISKKIEDWREIISLAKLDCELVLNNKLKIMMHPNLAEILVSNLLSNAINHNIEQGLIKIEVLGSAINFRNTGKSPLKNPDTIFNRFHKEKHTPNSVGLGLAIAKKICDTYLIKLEYSFHNNQHSFSLIFPL